jgi:hypothetical protein
MCVWTICLILTLGHTAGKATFFSHNGVSIDDYCICSSSFLSNIVNFQVEEFIPNLSDHCPITVELHASDSWFFFIKSDCIYFCVKLSNLLKNTPKIIDFQVAVLRFYLILLTFKLKNLYLIYLIIVQ